MMGAVAHFVSKCWLFDSQSHNVENPSSSQRESSTLHAKGSLSYSCQPVYLKSESLSNCLFLCRTPLPNANHIHRGHFLISGEGALRSRLHIHSSQSVSSLVLLCFVPVLLPSVPLALSLGGFNILSARQSLCIKRGFCHTPPLVCFSTLRPSSPLLPPPFCHTLNFWLPSFYCFYESHFLSFPSSLTLRPWPLLLSFVHMPALFRLSLPLFG